MPGLTTAFAATACSTAHAGLSFMTLGDWGAEAITEPSYDQSHQNVKNVAAAMATSATANDVQFIVNTGDNFYWCGISNASDFQVQKSWVEPYAAAPLQIPWYGVLGNHEYGYNVDAQIELSSLYTNWVMDARYFTRRLPLDGSHFATLIFLDTSPCVAQYRASDKSRWDPCGSDYPTCSLSGGSDKFEGDCMFNQNILSQDCSAQAAWFAQTLKAVPAEDWLIVVGHHPAYEIDVEDMTTPMQEHGFDLYLNGHQHVLTQYTVDGKGAYVTSGAGSLVLTHDQIGEAAPQSDKHSHKTVYSKTTSGFTLHTFSDDYTTLTTEFVDTAGKTLHSFTVSKGGGPSPVPSPAPSPTPSPSPQAACASIGCGAYKKSNPCQCNSGCKKYGNCCDDYDSICGSTPSGHQRQDEFQMV